MNESSLPPTHGLLSAAFITVLHTHSCVTPETHRRVRCLDGLKIFVPWWGGDKCLSCGKKPEIRHSITNSLPCFYISVNQFIPSCPFILHLWNEKMKDVEVNVFTDKKQIVRLFVGTLCYGDCTVQRSGKNPRYSTSIKALWDIRCTL